MKERSTTSKFCTARNLTTTPHVTRAIQLTHSLHHYINPPISFHHFSFPLQLALDSLPLRFRERGECIRWGKLLTLQLTSTNQILDLHFSFRSLPSALPIFNSARFRETIASYSRIFCSAFRCVLFDYCTFGSNLCW